MNFNFVAFMNSHFGGIDGVLKALPKGAVTRGAIVKWFQRNAVPSEYFAILVAAVYPELNTYWMLE